MPTEDTTLWGPRGVVSIHPEDMRLGAPRPWRMPSGEGGGTGRQLGAVFVLYRWW